MLTTIRKLREIARRCARGEALDADLARWLGHGLEEYLVRHYRTLEDALGLKSPRGGVPWWLEEAMRQRDAALRSLAGQLFEALPTAVQAKRIHDLAVRYCSSAWLFDRAKEEMPANYAGKALEWLWRAFKSGAPMPIGERQLRTILAR